MMTSAEIRRQFLEFFRQRGHEVVSSSSLVPGNDPTLLFTNAGMVQFKDVFLGKDPRPYQRAATVQCCVRAGGKHNDLENVGYTARHHTFFEMLGNFSFGDYFKRDAIHFAWEFLTGLLKLPKERLWVTVYATDDEAYNLWTKEIGIPLDRITRIGDKPGGGSDNFWQMGDTGPCGPCTEIFYDHGPQIWGGPPGSPEEDGDRYIEIWNLVFMQYERDASGQLHPLPKPSVDTGMGLERLAAVLQGVHENYEIDTFSQLIHAAAKLAGTQDIRSPSLKVIADHIRACAFLVVDGVLPANEGRGYVLRRIIRRACRHGHKLGLNEAFFYRMVAPLVQEMGEDYPELRRGQAHAEKVIRQEEERFAQTLVQGMGLLNEKLKLLKSSAGSSVDASPPVLSGEIAFQLYDTYGFPLDLTQDVCREQAVTVDLAGFEQAMNQQRETARAASHFQVGEVMRLSDTLSADAIKHHEFLGYEQDQAATTVLALFKDNKSVTHLAAGERGTVVLERTPFYGESGGQVGDSGELIGTAGHFKVEDTRKGEQGVHLHHGSVSLGELKIGQAVTARIDIGRREPIRRNHSATHLLNAALRQQLGTHVAQKGSLVTAERLRFDFSHFEAVTAEQLRAVEDQVNQQILANCEAQTRVMAYPEAVAAGALSMAGESYADNVRVLSLGEFSVELCGGTHVRRTGDIGLFKIVSEGGVAAGVRRIEAVTGMGALAWVRERSRLLDELALLVRSAPDDLPRRIQQLQEESRRLDREVSKLQRQLASGQGSDLASQVIDIGDTKLLAARLDGLDASAMRETMDKLKSTLQQAVILLASVDDQGKVMLVAGVTQNRVDRVNAGQLVGMVAEKLGGRGGGRADMAQAGAKDAARLDEVLATVPDWVRSRLG